MMFLSEVHASNESALSERPVLQTWEGLGYSWQEGGSEYTLPQKQPLRAFAASERCPVTPQLLSFLPQTMSTAVLPPSLRPSPQLSSPLPQTISTAVLPPQLGPSLHLLLSFAPYPITSLVSHQPPSPLELLSPPFSTDIMVSFIFQRYILCE